VIICERYIHFEQYRRRLLLVSSSYREILSNRREAISNGRVLSTYPRSHIYSLSAAHFPEHSYYQLITLLIRSFEFRASSVKYRRITNRITNWYTQMRHLSRDRQRAKMIRRLRNGERTNYAVQITENLKNPFVYICYDWQGTTRIENN